jgi:hypothetical protein
MYYRTRREWQTRPGIASNEQVDQLCVDLSRDGYAIVRDFKSRTECDELRAEVDRVINQYDAKLWRDEHNSDVRAFGIEQVSSKIAGFSNDPLINNVARRYLSDDQTCFFTLANRVTPTPHNLGSGGGWHRDTPHERQFKSLLYLADVSAENGPFEYLQGSHHLGFLLNTIARDRIQFAQHRFTEDEVHAIAERVANPPTVFTGTAGTLLLVDSSGIHRGRPIQSGMRYALTNYFFDRLSIERLKASGKFTGYFVNRPS